MLTSLELPNTEPMFEYWDAPFEGRKILFNLTPVAKAVEQYLAKHNQQMQSTLMTSRLQLAQYLDNL